MSRLIVTLVSVLFSTSVFAADISKSFDLPTFTGIDVGGHYDIEMVVGSEQKVTASSNHKTIKRLELSVANGKLRKLLCLLVQL